MPFHRRHGTHITDIIISPLRVSHIYVWDVEKVYLQASNLHCFLGKTFNSNGVLTSPLFRNHNLDPSPKTRPFFFLQMLTSVFKGFWFSKCSGEHPYTIFKLPMCIVFRERPLMQWPCLHPHFSETITLTPPQDSHILSFRCCKVCLGNPDFQNVLGSNLALNAARSLGKTAQLYPWSPWTNHLSIKNIILIICPFVSPGKVAADTPANREIPGKLHKIRR